MITTPQVAPFASSRMLLAIVLAVLAGGCASIVNDDTVAIRIESRPAGAFMYVEGDTTRYLTPDRIVRRRSSEDLVLTLEVDSLRKRVVVPSEFSKYFWLDFYPGLWPGLIVDLQSDRRYTYDSEIYVDLLDSSSDYSTWNIFAEPETFRLSAWLSFLGMPFPDLTMHQFNVGEQRAEKGGLNGMGLMLLYSPSPTELSILYADARSTVIGECFGPCPGTERGTFSVIALHGRQWLRAWLTAGIHTTFSAVNHREILPGGMEVLEMFTRTAEIGPAVNGAFRVSEEYWIVVGYQPSLFEFDRMKGVYTHQLSLSLRGVW